MKTALTRKESAHLISLGVPKEKASGKYIVPQGKPIVSSVGVLNETAEIYPIFKLEDFLNGEMLPHEIYSEEFKNHQGNEILPESYGNYELVFRREFGKWKASYINDEDWELKFFFADELIASLYRLACWYYGEYLKSEKK